MKQKKTTPQLKKTLDRVFKKKIRTRYSVNGFAICVSCPKRIELGTSDYHAGHYIPSTYTILRWEDDNVHAQCSGCNVFKRGNLIEYRKGLEDKIGKDREREMWEIRHTIFKPTREWLEERIEQEKEEIKLLSNSA